MIAAHPTAYGAWVVDSGDPDFQKFLLEQADRDIRWIPDSAGICIDRTDCAARNNTHADDGVSWVNGRAVRSLCVSWNDLLSKLGPKMHDAGKVIFASPLYARLDVYRQIDGIYDEFGYDGRGAERQRADGAGQAGAGVDLQRIAFPARSRFVFPAASADGRLSDRAVSVEQPLHHSRYELGRVLLSTTARCSSGTPGTSGLRPEQYYLAYGPLLDAMRGKKWVLAPHCVEVVGDTAKANLFQVPGGYAMPVCFGGKAEFADVMIRNIPGLDSFKYSVIHPGVETAASPTILFKDKDGATMLRVPLVRGCAMVTLRK